ncbi:MAG: UDP-3-O-acyl-N-acetylglucosamine deacetylase [Bacteroidales bacterium]|nr:UDP-3-O-acyl-N-acetylglucosamine deacetylase [Bacteroidales bacterium]MDD4670497.1 UDP-3-O-acyl-N-acetylglucosamine deacetylase [Bacteroidales bacterium]
MNQHTLNQSYTFKGKGLHTGAEVQMTILPAPENHGIVFQRTDLGREIFVEAVSTNIARTARSTSLEKNGAEVITTEHLLAAMSGLGIDNALIRLNSAELPILDGSSRLYVDAFLADGLHRQSVERKYYTIDKPFHYKDEKSGSELIIEPSDELKICVEIDYNSRVLGLQRAEYDSSVDFAKEIAPSRTFCFFHELEFLLNNNLIKGGDMDNAIVIVEHEVSEDVLNRMKVIFNVDNLERVPEGYLNNLKLHFPNECARHKLLDLIGDFALLGKPIKANIFAKKSGHNINTTVVKTLISQSILNI